MPGRCTLLRLLAAVAPFAHGCSLMNLDEVAQVPCSEGCAEANRAAGLDPDRMCFAYRCNEDDLCVMAAADGDEDGAFDEHLCAGEVPDAELDCADGKGDGNRSRAHAEECDGIDNDCDHFIDEGVHADEAIERVDLTDGLNVGHVAVSAAENGDLYIALTSPQNVDGFANEAVWLPGDGSAPSVKASVVDDGSRCHSADESCSFSQLAIAARSGRAFGLGINRSGCEAGQARVGGGTGDPPVLSFEAESSPLVEVEPGAALDGGAGDAACSTSASCRGARDPVVTLFPRRNESDWLEGLALWVGPADGQDGCPNDELSAIHGLGLRMAPDAAAALVATQSGRPDQLATGIGSGSPAVVAWDGADAGYIVGYAGERALELLYVARSEDVADSLLTGLRAGRIAQPSVAHVALAARTPASSGEPALAAVWRSDTGIVFSELGFERDADEPFARVGDPVELGQLDRDAEIAFGPALVYASSGFREGADEPAGGWFVAWIESRGTEQRLVGARIAAADRTSLGEPFELASGELSHVFAYAVDGADLRYGYVDHATDPNELRVAAIGCD
jgi:hypothetical protein